MTAPRVLVIEDDPDGLASVRDVLADGGYEVAAAETGRDGVRTFRDTGGDVVLTDLVLPDISGLDVLEEVRRLNPEVPVLIMTAYGTVDTAVRALRAGAYDYLVKPLDLDDVQAKVGRAAETSRLRAEIHSLHAEAHARYAAASMVARSPAMREVVRQIRLLADASATVLVTGETGTGKELVARALHVESRRAEQPFVAVSCGAFAETVLESELFGHEKGAFTGAAQLHRGAFERADGGTLFLDEIGLAPRTVQSRLLRVLEEREVLRVGGSRPVPIEVRIVAATNRDLSGLVAAGEFLEDLLYRLQVVTIALPPLRERPEDVRPLIDRFAARACREQGRDLRQIAPDYYEALENRAWPGNVRQLRNVVEASVVMTAGNTLTAAHLGGVETPAPARSDGVFLPPGATLAELEREVMGRSLKRHGGSRTECARELGVSVRTVQRKIKEYRLPF